MSLTIIGVDSHLDCSSIILEAVSTILGLSFDEIDTVAGDNTFIQLGGDSLAAILIAAKCQRSGISIPASIFLRTSSLKEAISKAQSSAQTLPINTNALLTPAHTPPLLPSESSEGLTDASPSLAENVSNESSQFPCAYDKCITTLTFEACKKISCYRGERITRLKSLSARDLLSRINPIEWTETQLLLLRDTSNDEKRNILTIQKTYTGDWNPDSVCSFWTNTILAEPIFRDIIIDLDISPHDLMPRKLIQVENEQELQDELHHAILTTGHLSHLTVVKLASSCVVVVWRVHHSFMDGFSARIVQEKINHNRSEGRVKFTPGPSFKATVLELSQLREERREATRQFWDRKRAQFSSAIGSLSLNPQRIRGVSTTQQCITVSFPESELAAAQVRTGYTTTIYFAAAWALTLGFFMDTDQVYFGMALSGRDLPILGAFDVVGPLINILPLFVELPLESDEATSVRGFLRTVQEGILELNDAQHSDTTDGFDRNFGSLVATQFNETQRTETPLLTGTSQPDSELERSDMQSGIPLNLIIQNHGQLEAFYSTAHYSEADMKNVWSVFQNIMSYLLRGDDERLLAPLIQHDLMPHEMEQTIRKLSNCESSETRDESKGDDLVTLFESVVARQPTSIAISRGHGEEISYDNFDQKAAAIAREISWIELNEPVCVYADRSVNWLIAIFGVLKAGGIYTPLDPSAPSSVRQANFDRSGARAVLFPSRISIFEDTTPIGSLVMAVDELMEKNKRKAQQEPLFGYYPRRRIARPDDIAYICFTSGSTGQPKAVQCTHKGLVAFQKDYTVRLAAKKGTVVAQVMSPVFDGSIHEIFSALTYGATLRLASETQDHPFAHLQDSDSTILTPSIANALDPDHYPRLRNVYLVGESVPQSVCNAWGKDRFLYNMYGPTETTCGATIKQLIPGKAVSVGNANPSSRVYILSRNQRLLPPGAVGELFLAGVQVSNGYINLPSENASRFLPDSILPEAGQKMYKTGDYAYRDSVTGEVHIIGRKDRQIKLHGFRLDLDDLEIRIAKVIPNCETVAVFRRDDYLVAAYQVSPSSTNLLGELEVKMLVSNVLPPYAVPRRAFRLSEIPLTTAGKLDYKTLEKMDLDCGLRLHIEQKAMTETEMMIVRVVYDLMKLHPSIPVNRDSDLTALGGHSIVQLRLASQISTLIKQKFSVRRVIDNPVISDLALSVDKIVRERQSRDLSRETIIAKLQAAATEEMWTQPPSPCYDRQAAEPEGSRVSPIQSVWFSKYQQNLGTTSFNVSHVSEFDDSFDRHARLVSAWTMVMSKYPILRCRFRVSSTSYGGIEKSFAAEPPKALYVDSFDIRAAINTEFSLDTDNPIRVLVSRRYMLVCMSHIVCDYTTLDRLFAEFTAIYYCEDSLAESQLAFPARHESMISTATDVDLATSTFWRSYLSGIDFSALPPYMKEARRSYQGESHMFQLSKATISNLETISRSLHLTMHQIALAIVSLVLQTDSTTKEGLILGSPYLGRQEEDMNTIGLFLQPLPIRVPRSTKAGKNLSDTDVRGFLLAVQDSSRSALGHAMEWTSLLSILSASDDENLRAAATTSGPNHPLFDAMVTFHERSVTGQASTLGEETLPGVDPLITWADGSKFGITFEFSVVKSSVVTLRIEHDNSLFSADEVWDMARRIDIGLEILCKNITSSITLHDLEDRLWHLDPVVDGVGIKEIAFGTSLKSFV